MQLASGYSYLELYLGQCFGLERVQLPTKETAC